MMRPPVILAFLFGLAPVSATQPHEPVLLRATIPDYPDVARQALVSGSVVVRVEIAESGAVRDAVAESGIPLLAQGALLAAKRWKFSPAQHQTNARLMFVYTLASPEECHADTWSSFGPPLTVEVRATRPWFDLCSHCTPKPSPTPRPCE